MVARASVFRDIFADLRKDLFFGEAGRPSDVEVLRGQLLTARDHGRFALWRRLRDLGVNPDEPEASTVLGVIMEIGTEDACTVLTFGLSDGSASVYFSNGGGHIGGEANPQVNAAARALTAVAAEFVAGLPVTKDHPLPGEGRVRLSILTPGGVHVGEEAQSTLANDGSPLSPLFKAACQIVVGFRTAEHPESSAESTYVRCLLTALARGDGEAALRDDDQPLPDPATFVTDPKDLEWMTRPNVPVDRISARKVIATLLRSAGFRRFHPRERERTGRAKLATSEWSMEDIAFKVSRHKERGRTHVQVRILRSA